MAVEVVLFFILALVAISGAVMVINTHKMAHMILSMVFSFLAIAGLYFLLRAEFIAIVQVIVYAGALAILFVFGIMMTDHRQLFEITSAYRVHQFLSLAGVTALLGLILYGISTLQVPATAPTTVGSTKDIGIALYGSYVIAFEALGILLLVALIGAIVIARKEEAE